MRTEYLVPISKEGTFATTTNSFNSLLMSDSSVTIGDNKIIFDDSTFGYTVQQDNSNSAYHYYHLTIETGEGDDSLESEMVLRYIKLLKHIKKVLLDHAQKVEVLWDDVSFSCSAKAYPMIYTTENILRKLFTKFMMINVGISWEKNNSPKINARDIKGNDKLGNSLLYKVDFKDLSTFLFDNYSKEDSLKSEYIEKNLSEDGNISLESLGDFIKKSNWERYFNTHVKFEQEELKKKLERLYELRNKVAHNRLMDLQDLEIIKELTSEINEKLNEVILNMDEISIIDNEREDVFENLAKNRFESSGQFLHFFNMLEEQLRNLLANRSVQDTDNMSLRKVLNEAIKFGVITIYQKRQFDEVVKFRNSLIHSPQSSINQSDVKDYTDAITVLQSQIEYQEFVEPNSNIVISKGAGIVCSNCLDSFVIDETELECIRSDEGRSMGMENIYMSNTISMCPKCGNQIEVQTEIYEYPKGNINYISHKVDGGEVISDAEFMFA